MRKDKALLALTILLFVACSGKTTSAPVLTSVGPSGGPVSISFAVPSWELELGYLNRLVKEFEAQNPGIRVGLKSFNEILDLPPGGFYPTDDFWFKLASAADVFQVIFVNGIDRQAVRDGLVRDLKPFIDADPTFHAYDFYPGALEAAAWDGGIWAMPTALNYELILFDKEAFDAAGVAYPEIGWTWDDFLAKARSLTVRSGDQVTYWGFVQSDFMFRPAIFIELRTGPLLDEATTPPTPRFTDAEVAKAVQWWADLILKDQVMPYQSLPETSDGGSTLVEQGIAAMEPSTLPGSRWVRHNQLQKVGVVPYPIGAPDSRTTPIYFEQVVMSAGTAHPEAAWRWLGFLSRQPPSHGQVPARRSVAEATGFWDELDEELASALHFAMAHATQSSLADWGVAYEALNGELRAVFEGKKSVEEALVAAQVQAMADLETEAAQRTAATPSPVVVATAEPRPAEGAVTITFMPLGNTLGLKPFRDAARQFHAAHPDVVVEIKDPSSTAGSIAGLAEQADCFQYIPYLDSPQTLTAILSLEPFLEAEPSFDLDDFFPLLLAQYRRGGEIWGLPAQAQPYVIEYNQDLFDAVGREYPRADWTLDDFLALAQDLTWGEGKNKQYGFVGTTYEMLDLLMFVERLGGKVLDDAQDPLAATFNDPATMEAVEWYADLYLLHGVRPIFVTEEERRALINHGRAAMWASPFGQHDELRSGVLPFPQGPLDSGGPILNATGYFISAKTTAPQACWEWLRFLSERIPDTGTLPPRHSLLTSDAFREQVGEDAQAVYLEALECEEQVGFCGLESLPPYSSRAIYPWLEQALGEILWQGADAQATLSEAQQKAEAYLDCLRQRPDPEDWETADACFQEVDAP